MAVHVGSSSEWRQILQSTIVVADCKCAAMPQPAHPLPN